VAEMQSRTTILIMDLSRLKAELQTPQNL